MSLFSASRKSITPSSILKKTPSMKSTLNLSLKCNTANKVRFMLPHSKKVHIILKDFIQEKNIKDYENLICLIRDSQLFDEDISSLLKEATECISIIKAELRLFVEAILSINWIERSDSVVSQYQGFVTNLVSAHNYHAERVIKHLVALFVPVPTNTEWDSGKPPQADFFRCQHVHSLLMELLRAVPLCRDLLIQALTNQFPYLNKNTQAHEFYIQNLLWIIHYQPNLRIDVFSLILLKLMVLDVNAPREKILACKEDEEIFMMECDAKTNAMLELASTHEIAHTLDVCLDKVFNYLRSECYELDSNELNWPKTKTLYQDILVTFDKVILPTYNSHHVQFVMFVLCSFNVNLTEAFLNYLWRKVCNPNMAVILRQSSINYIVSFLARANFIPLTLLKNTLQLISDWLNSYVATQDGLECVNSDLRIHTVFFTVCQALFYVVAFRHKDLVSNKSNVVFLQSLNLSKIVTSRLNPLRVCQPAVAQYFAAVTRKYQLAYCYSVMEHNLRNTLPTVYRNDKGYVTITDNVLDVSYPFDPYVLPSSGFKVRPCYRSYKENNLGILSVDMKGFGDDDCVEPDDVSLNSKLKKFSYGTSPGFKF